MGIFPFWTAYSYGDQYRADFPVPANLYEVTDSGLATGPAVADGSTECRGNAPPFDQVAPVGCNLTEWIDACETGPKYTNCALHFIPRYPDPIDKVSRCDYHTEKWPQDATAGVGIRCCHD